MGSACQVKPKPANPIWAWNHGARNLGTGSTFVCVVLQIALFYTFVCVVLQSALFSIGGGIDLHRPLTRTKKETVRPTMLTFQKVNRPDQTLTWNPLQDSIENWSFVQGW
jgi:hypothetical protein